MAKTKEIEKVEEGKVTLAFQCSDELGWYVNQEAQRLGESISTYLRGLVRADKEAKEVKR